MKARRRRFENDEIEIPPLGRSGGGKVVIVGNERAHPYMNVYETAGREEALVGSVDGRELRKIAHAIAKRLGCKLVPRVCVL